MLEVVVAALGTQLAVLAELAVVEQEDAPQVAE
jgi:hypothetical protein